MVEDVFVGAAVGLVQRGVDVEIVVAGIEGAPGQIVEEVVVRLVAGRSV